MITIAIDMYACWENPIEHSTPWLFYIVAFVELMIEFELIHMYLRGI